MDLKAIQNSMAIGSENYHKVAQQVKEFLNFNGYSQTLAKIEQEEGKVLASAQGNHAGENNGGVAGAGDSVKPTLDVSYPGLHAPLIDDIFVLGRLAESLTLGFPQAILFLRWGID